MSLLRKINFFQCFNITGAIPQGIEKLADLERLDFTGCKKLTGLIPNIGQCQSLKHVSFLGCVRLAGPPPSFAKWHVPDHLALPDHLAAQAKASAEAHVMSEMAWETQGRAAAWAEVASTSFSAAEGARALLNMSMLYAKGSRADLELLRRASLILEDTIERAQREGAKEEKEGKSEDPGDKGISDSGPRSHDAADAAPKEAGLPKVSAEQVVALSQTPPAQVFVELESACEQDPAMQTAILAAARDYEGFVRTTREVGKVVEAFAVVPAPESYLSSAAAVASAMRLTDDVIKTAKAAIDNPSPETLGALRGALDTATAAKLTAEAGCPEVIVGIEAVHSVELWLELSGDIKTAGADRDALTAAVLHIKNRRHAAANKPFAPALVPAFCKILEQAPSTIEDLAEAATAKGLQHALKWGGCLQSIAEVIAEEEPAAAEVRMARERAEALAALEKPVEELFPVLEHAQLGQHASQIISWLKAELDVNCLADLNHQVVEECAVEGGDIMKLTGAADRKTARRQFQALEAAIETFMKRLSSWAGSGDGAGDGREGKGEDDEKTRLPYESVEAHEDIGEGAFGTVCRATLSKILETGKVINKACAAKRLRGAAFKDPRKIRMILDECHIMFETDHPFICACLGHARAPQDLLLVMEYCSGGDLLGRTRKAEARGEPMARAETLQLCLMAASAIKYIHSKGMIHRDIAGRNFLITISLEGVVVCKMADFGMSRKIEEDKDYYALDSTAEKNAEGKVINLEIPVAWSAPECFEKKLGKDGQKHYVVGPPNDVWAFNVMAFEVVSGGLEPYLEPGTICVIDDKGKVVQDSIDKRDYITKFVRDGGRLVVPPTAPASLQGTMQHCWTTGTAAPDRQTMPQVIEALCADKLHKAREWGSKEWRAFVTDICGMALSDDEDQVAELVEYWDDEDMQRDGDLFKDSTYSAAHFKGGAAGLAKFKRELEGLRNLFEAWDKKVLDTDKL